jgi:hypothetical protein
MRTAPAEVLVLELDDRGALVSRIEPEGAYGWQAIEQAVDRHPDTATTTAMNDAQLQTAVKQRVVDGTFDAHESVGHEQSVKVDFGRRGDAFGRLIHERGRRLRRRSLLASRLRWQFQRPDPGSLDDNLEASYLDDDAPATAHLPDNALAKRRLHLVANAEPRVHGGSLLFPLCPAPNAGGESRRSEGLRPVGGRRALLHQRRRHAGPDRQTMVLEDVGGEAIDQDLFAAVSTLGLSRGWVRTLHSLSAWLVRCPGVKARRTRYEMQINDPARRSVAYAGYLIEADALAPYPFAVNTINRIAPDLYRLTLTIDRQ